MTTAEWFLPYFRSPELFADLFEDWMRGDNKIDLDCCDPARLNSETALPVRSRNEPERETR